MNGIIIRTPFLGDYFRRYLLAVIFLALRTA